MSEITPKAVKAALDAATPGPWSARRWFGDKWPEDRWSVGASYTGMAVCVSPRYADHNDLRDAVFIAMAPDLATAYLAQAAERDALAEKLEEATQILDQCTWSNIYVSGRVAGDKYVDRKKFVTDCRAALAAIQVTTDD